MGLIEVEVNIKKKEERAPEVFIQAERQIGRQGGRQLLLTSARYNLTSVKLRTLR
jgi:hypothetical protein